MSNFLNRIFIIIIEVASFPGPWLSFTVHNTNKALHCTPHIHTPSYRTLANPALSFECLPTRYHSLVYIWRSLGWKDSIKTITNTVQIFCFVNNFFLFFHVNSFDQISPCECLTTWKGNGHLQDVLSFVRLEKLDLF